MNHMLGLVPFLNVLSPTREPENTTQAAKCYPTNDMLSGALQPLINQLTGAVGGLILPLAGFVIVIAALGGLLWAFRQQSAAPFWRIVMAVVSVVAVLIGAMLILSKVLVELNNIC